MRRVRVECKKLFSSFRALNGAPSELWMIFLLKLLESFAYFAIAQTMTLFLSEEYGFDDKSSGILYGIYGAGISVYGMLLGNSLDRLGIQKSLQLGFSLSFCSRFLLAVSSSKWLLYANLFLVLPLSGAMGIPVMVVGVRRLTHEWNRGFAFGIFYVMMNLGGLLCGPTIDFFTIFWPRISGSEWSGNRIILLMCALSSFLGALIASFFLNDKRLHAEVTKEKASQQREGIGEMMKDSTFRRFFVFSVIMVNLRGIFRHLDATLPKYLVRMHGKDVGKGLIFSINPAVIISLVPLISAVTSNIDAFRMIIVGGYISATSCIYLAFSSSTTAAVLFVLQLSVGEAMWSPRFLDYQAYIAPPGREATFIAIASAPLFLSKLPVGYLSGYLLQNYCPADLPCDGVKTTCAEWLSSATSCAVDFCIECSSLFLAGTCNSTCGFCDKEYRCEDSLTLCPPAPERSPKTMWMVILLVTLASPVLVHVFRPWLQEPAIDTSRHTELKQHDEETTGLFENAQIIDT